MESKLPHRRRQPAREDRTCPALGQLLRRRLPAGTRRQRSAQYPEKALPTCPTQHVTHLPGWTLHTADTATVTATAPVTHAALRHSEFPLIPRQAKRNSRAHWNTRAFDDQAAHPNGTIVWGYCRGRGRGRRKMSGHGHVYDLPRLSRDRGQPLTAGETTLDYAPRSGA
jgi:hypothetical protein